MKKMIVFTVALVAAVMSQAAMLDWKYTATKDNVGDTVYVLLGSTAVSEWENIDALKAEALGSGAVGVAGRQYIASGKIVSDALTKDSADIYYVVVASGEKTFSVTSVSDMKASVYGEQDSAPGANTSLSPASITKSGLAWGSGSDPVVPTPTPDVPEPTSGLLLLVGGAALALRRKQK